MDICCVKKVAFSPDPKVMSELISDDVLRSKDAQEMTVWAYIACVLVPDMRQIPDYETRWTCLETIILAMIEMGAMEAYESEREDRRESSHILAGSTTREAVRSGHSRRRW